MADAAPKGREEVEANRGGAKSLLALRRHPPPGTAEAEMGQPILSSVNDDSTRLIPPTWFVNCRSPCEEYTFCSTPTTGSRLVGTDTDSTPSCQRENCATTCRALDVGENPWTLMSAGLLTQVWEMHRMKRFTQHR